MGIGNADAPNKLTVTALGDVNGANSGGGLLLQDSAADTTGGKLRIDVNEMQTSNNGVASGFSVNPFGGTTYFGSSNSSSLPLESRSTAEHSLRLRTDFGDYYTDFVKRDAADGRPHAFDIYNRSNGT